MKKNYCKAERLLSYCTAKIRDYLKCKYGARSSHGDYCMYRDESIRSERGEDHCCCAEAQAEARKTYQEERIEEAEEGDIPT
jgi:hypothetical protein